jgi:endonuclease-3 related protein
MVVDSYTQRLLSALGYAFESYSEIQTWLSEGVAENLSEIAKLYDETFPLSTIYSRFHGKIVEYAKVHIKGKSVYVEELCQ